jgi:hypothetical protein
MTFGYNRLVGALHVRLGIVFKFKDCSLIQLCRTYNEEVIEQTIMIVGLYHNNKAPKIEYKKNLNQVWSKKVKEMLKVLFQP